MRSAIVLKEQRVDSDRWKVSEYSLFILISFINSILRICSYSVARWYIKKFVIPQPTTSRSASIGYRIYKCFLFRVLCRLSCAGIFMRFKKCHFDYAVCFSGSVAMELLSSCFTTSSQAHRCDMFLQSPELSAPIVWHCADPVSSLRWILLKNHLEINSVLHTADLTGYCSSMLLSVKVFHASESGTFAIRHRSARYYRVMFYVFKSYLAAI